MASSNREACFGSVSNETVKFLIYNANAPSSTVRRRYFPVNCDISNSILIVLRIAHLQVTRSEGNSKTRSCTNTGLLLTTDNWANKCETNSAAVWTWSKWKYEVFYYLLYASGNWQLTVNFNEVADTGCIETSINKPLTVLTLVLCPCTIAALPSDYISISNKYYGIFNSLWNRRVPVPCRQWWMYAYQVAVWGRSRLWWWFGWRPCSVRSRSK